MMVIRSQIKFMCDDNDAVMSSDGWALYYIELFVVEKEEEGLFCVIEKGCVVCVFVASTKKLKSHRNSN